MGFIAEEGEINNEITAAFETSQLHGSQKSDLITHSVAVSIPIYQPTSCVFDNNAHTQRLFGFEEPGNIYSRSMNPTNNVQEERTADGTESACRFNDGLELFVHLTNVAYTKPQQITSLPRPISGFPLRHLQLQASPRIWSAFPSDLRTVMI